MTFIAPGLPGVFFDGLLTLELKYWAIDSSRLEIPEAGHCGPAARWAMQRHVARRRRFSTSYGAMFHNFPNRPNPERT